MDSDLEDSIVGNGIWQSEKCSLPPRSVPHLKFMDSSRRKYGGIERFFKMGPLLGHGRFGKVYAARDLLGRDQFALKIVDKFPDRKSTKSGGGATVGPRASHGNVPVLTREISLLRVLQHPHIVQLLEIYESPKAVCLVFEKCGPSLRSFLLERNGPLSERETAHVVASLAKALAYLHSNEIAHRDLKLENILCQNGPLTAAGGLGGQVKLNDFGLGACRGSPGTTNMFTCCCGTPEYMAPEILSRIPYNQLCDIWSLGVVTFYCLIGMPPFPGKTQQDVLLQIQLSKVTLKGKPWEAISSQAKSTIKAMLTIDPTQRPTAHQLLLSPWLRTSRTTPVATAQAQAAVDAAAAAEAEEEENCPDKS